MFVLESQPATFFYVLSSVDSAEVEATYSLEDVETRISNGSHDRDPTSDIIVLKHSKPG